MMTTKEKKKWAVFPALAGAATWLSNLASKASFEGQTVIITGGSRGLGFALAKQLVLEKANVAILARDEYELSNALEYLRNLECGTVISAVCDVTDKAQLTRAFVKVVNQFGGIDMLINNAGNIIVGPWETMTQKDFEAQMALHVYAPMNAVKLALPFLRDNSSGKRIVNICSMGGKVAVPHMVPYDTSKFALAGFSQGITAELAGEGISVTTIYPAVMRTGSPIQAVFKGDHEKEFAWFQTGDVLPGFSMSAQAAAKCILDAARDRRRELIPSLPGKVRMAAAAFFPETMGWVMEVMAAQMPKGKSSRYQTGYESRRFFETNKWTSMLADKAHEAEEENNQRPKVDAKFNLGLH